jgi:hypothetical protein
MQVDLIARKEKGPEETPRKILIIRIKRIPFKI